VSGTYPVFAKFVHILTSRDRVFASGLSGSRSGSMCPTRNKYPKSSAWHTPGSQRASAKVCHNFWVPYSNDTGLVCCRPFRINYSNMTYKAVQLTCWCEAEKNLANSEYFDGLNGKENGPVRQNLSDTALYNTLIGPSTLYAWLQIRSEKRLLWNLTNAELIY
jgi:hypothetical protein